MTERTLSIIGEHPPASIDSAAAQLLAKPGPKRVWVAEQGAHDQWVEGVYASPMDAAESIDSGRKANWRVDHDGTWENDLHDQAYVTIRPFDVEGAGDEDWNMAFELHPNRAGWSATFTRRSGQASPAGQAMAVKMAVSPEDTTSA